MDDKLSDKEKAGSKPSPKSSPKHHIENEQQHHHSSRKKSDARRPSSLDALNSDKHESKRSKKEKDSLVPPQKEALALRNSFPGNDAVSAGKRDSLSVQTSGASRLSMREQLSPRTNLPLGSPRLGTYKSPRSAHGSKRSLGRNNSNDSHDERLNLLDPTDRVFERTPSFKRQGSGKRRRSFETPDQKPARISHRRTMSERRPRGGSMRRGTIAASAMDRRMSNLPEVAHSRRVSLAPSDIGLNPVDARKLSGGSMSMKSGDLGQRYTSTPFGLGGTLAAHGRNKKPSGGIFIACLIIAVGVVALLASYGSKGQVWTIIGAVFMGLGGLACFAGVCWYCCSVPVETEQKDGHKSVHLQVVTQEELNDVRSAPIKEASSHNSSNSHV